MTDEYIVKNRENYSTYVFRSNQLDMHVACTMYRYSYQPKVPVTYRVIYSEH